MYSGTSSGGAWTSSDHPAGNGSSGNGMSSLPVQGEGNYRHGNVRASEYKPWQIVSAALEETKNSRNTEKDVLCNVLRTLERSLTPVAVAEIIVLIGRRFLSLDCDYEQFNAARASLVEAVDGIGNVKWDAVFLSLPKVDPKLNINSLACFAFFMAVFQSKTSLNTRFPIEMGFRGGWLSTLNQTIFLKWVIAAVTTMSMPPPYQRIPIMTHLRAVELGPDSALLETCPLLFSVNPLLSSLWCNTQLVAALANIAAGVVSDAACGESDNAETAAHTAFDILKRSAGKFPDALLCALVRSSDAPFSVARSLAAECLEQLWMLLTAVNQQTRLSKSELSHFFLRLAGLSPQRFGSIVLGSLYPRNPERVETVIAALQPNNEVLSNVLYGTVAPYCFHAMHIAKSPKFSPAPWLKQRLQRDDVDNVVKDFIFFLTLTLCPATLLQQHQQKVPQLASAHPVRQLCITPQDLLLYLVVVAEALNQRKNKLHETSVNAETGLEAPNAMTLDFGPIDFTSVASQPREVLMSHLAQVKQVLAKFLPQLNGILEFIQPNDTEMEKQQREEESLGASHLPANVQNSLELNADVYVHKLFADLYSENVSCADMVALMRKMALSPTTTQVYKIFDRMVRLLFHECRFFPKYPLCKLGITAEFMGQLIDSEVLMAHGQQLGATHILALRSILEGLKKGPQSKTFRFAATAMEFFISPRLAMCPDFLVALSSGIPDVRNYFPTYADFADKCLAALPPELRNGHVMIDRKTLAEHALPAAPPPVVHPEFSLSRSREQRPVSGTGEPSRSNVPTSHLNSENNVPLSMSNGPQSALHGSGASNALNSSDGLPVQKPLLVNGCPISLEGFGLGTVEHLLSLDPTLQPPKPPQGFCEHLAQLFNSLVLTNVQQKALELRPVLQPEWHPFMALYIVKSRALKETGFHEVYIKFVEAVGRPKLLDTVIATSYDCINALLSYCDAAKEATSYRKVLQNLGSWLGTITLTRNKPLKSKAIDIKNLLFDGYENGRLRVLLPLCCKILESVGKSKNFRPPNPWSVAILRLIAEIYALPGLVTPLVFEIELLFKNLGLSVHDFKGRTNNLSKRKTLPVANSPDFSHVTSLQQTSAHCVVPMSAGDVDGGRAKQGMGGQGNSSVTFVQQQHPQPYHQQQQDQPQQAYRMGASVGVGGGVSNHVSRAYISEMSRVNPELPRPLDSLAPAEAHESKFGVNGVASALASDVSLVRAFSPPTHQLPVSGQPEPEFVTKLNRRLSHSETAQPLATLNAEFVGSGNDKASQNVESGLLKSLRKSVVISPSLILFILKPELREVVPHAIECAIKEILGVVAERSVSISCATAREVVLKDFAAETNEGLVRRASHLFGATLAGSLALATCREPLRAAFNQHLRSLLLSANDKLSDGQGMVEQVVAVTTADNIELGCAIVEEAVVQRALQKVEEVLQPAFQIRRNARDAGLPYQDVEHLNSRWVRILPSPLQPRPVLPGDQLQVYREFLSFGPLHRMQHGNDGRGQHGTAPVDSQPNAEAFQLGRGYSGGPGFPAAPLLLDEHTISSPALVADPATNISFNEASVVPSFGGVPSEAMASLHSNGMSLQSKALSTPVSHSEWQGNDASSQPRTTASIELQVVLMRVEESLSHIKDIVHEITFSSPISGLKAAHTLKASAPLGAILDVVPIPPTINVVLSTLARLPSDHEIFAAVIAAPLACSFCGQPELAFLSICQRILRMIYDVGVLYREAPTLIRVSDVAGLYLEVFLGLLLHISKSSPLFPEKQFLYDVSTWVSSVLSENIFGACVVMGLLRYKLLSFSRLDEVLLEQASSNRDRLNQGLLDNMLRIVFQVASQANIQLTDVKSALRDLHETIQFLRQLPVEQLAEPCMSFEHMNAATQNEALSVSYARAKQEVLDRVDQVFAQPEENVSTSLLPKNEVPITTFAELLGNYATLGGEVVRMRRMPNPPELTQEQYVTVSACFHKWTFVSSLVGAERRTKAYAGFFQALSKLRLLQMDENTDWFLTGCIERAIELMANDSVSKDSTNEATTLESVELGKKEEESDGTTSAADKNGTQGAAQSLTLKPKVDDVLMETIPETESSPTSLKPLSVLAKMIVALMRLGDPSHLSPLLILQRTLSLLVRCVYRDAAVGTSNLNVIAYYRLLLNLLWEVTQPNRGLDRHALSLLLCFSNTFQHLSPCQCPQFAFCWLELIANSSFLPAILHHVRAWPHFQKLLSRLFTFLYPFHQKYNMSPGILTLYKGTLRLMVVLLNDFPEFLCEHHVVLTESLPFNSIQLRNLILSAFPRNTKLPDPSLPNLKVDLLPETRKTPRLYGNYLLLLLRSGMKNDLDQFCRTQNKQHILNIIPKLKRTDEKDIADLGTQYNVSLINALLLHLATQFPVEKDILNSKPSPDIAPPIVKIIHVLVETLDLEGRYIVLSCMSNHLRYPNTHAHYFSCLLLWLFGAFSSFPHIQEQITRALLERLIVHRPHPWGLLITFIELIKNPKFNFWNCSFVHEVPEVQALFQSVSQTCLRSSNITRNADYVNTPQQG